MYCGERTTQVCLRWLIMIPHFLHAENLTLSLTAYVPAR